MLLSIESSKAMFLFVLFIAPILLSISTVLEDKYIKISKIFLLLSFLMVFIPLGFRNCGIDHGTYKSMYSNIDSNLKSYMFTPEPLFLILNLFASHIFGSFQIVYLVCGFLFTFGIYHFILKHKDGNVFINLYCILFSIYIYMCGLTRMSVAIGIISIAFNYIRDSKKYFALVIIAFLWHYSACVAFLFYYAYNSKGNYKFRYNIFIIIVVFVVAKFLSSIGNSLPYVLARYADYLSPSINISAIKNMIILIPALIIFKVFNREYENELEDYVQINNIINFIFVFIFISIMFTGLFRFTFYFYPLIGYIYAKFPVILIRANGTIRLVYLYIISFVVVGCIYLSYVFFNSPYITRLIIPFEFNFYI